MRDMPYIDALIAAFCTSCDESSAADQAILFDASLEKSGWAIVRTTEIASLRAALEMIAGRRQCLDNLMSNVTIAETALDANEQNVGKDMSIITIDPASLSEKSVAEIDAELSVLYNYAAMALGLRALRAKSTDGYPPMPVDLSPRVEVVFQPTKHDS